MKWLFLIDDSLTNRISYYHLMLLMASLPFNMFYSHLILASFGIHTLIHLNKKTVKPVFQFRTIVLQSVFYITVLSTIYAINYRDAFNEWAKHITIFIFPLLFCLNPLDLKKYRPRLLMAFALVCTATIIYLYFDALITITHYKLPFSALLSSAFINHNFSEPIDMHATFFSMQVALSLVYLLSVLIREPVFYKKLFYLLCNGILIAGIMQLCSKSIFIVLVITINIALPYFLLKGAKRLRFIAVSVSLTILAGVIIFNARVFKERYVTELASDLSASALGQTTDSRLERWDAALALIGKSPVIGYGAGSEIGLLQKVFFDRKLYDSYLKRLNVHSQYLSFLIKSGGIGLLVYLFTLYFGFDICFRRGDLLFFTFLALVAVVSLSENFLDVDKGVIFYAIYFPFFIFSGGKSESAPNLLKQPQIFHTGATKRETIPSS